MEYTKLGSSDLTASRIGFGCWAIGGHGWGGIDDRESLVAIRRALELGVTLFDVADVYGFGHAEEILARGLGTERHSVLIATKFGLRWDSSIARDISPGRLSEALEASLRRLRVDCIPLYQIHWPDDHTPISRTMEALARHRDEGKIRWIGCCNFDAELLLEARQYGDIATIQVPYNVLDRAVEADVLPASRKLGISVLSYGSLAQGLLSGEYDESSTFPVGDVRRGSAAFRPPELRQNLEKVGRLREIGAKYGKTPAQVAIRWILDNPDMSCALTGIKTSDQIQENAAIDWTMTPDDRRLIDSISMSPRNDGHSLGLSRRATST